MKTIKDTAIVNFASGGSWYAENFFDGSGQFYQLYIFEPGRTFSLSYPDQGALIKINNTLEYLAKNKDTFEKLDPGLHEWMLRVANIDGEGKFLPWPIQRRYLDVEGQQVEVSGNARAGEITLRTDSTIIISFISELCTHNDELNYMERGQLLTRMSEALVETEGAESILPPEDRDDFIQLPQEYSGFNRITINGNVYLLMLKPELDLAILIIPKLTFSGKADVFEQLYPEVLAMKKGKLYEKVKFELAYMGI